MLKKLIIRFGRSLGIFAIFSFAVACIFTSLFVRDIDESTFLGKILNYTVSFENRFYDFRMREHIDPNFKSKEQVLIEIDDYSLQKIGTWPISRDYYSRVLNKLHHMGAKVVAMDILFPEKSLSCGENSPDQALIQGFKNFQSTGNFVFIGYGISNSNHDALKEVPAELFNFMPNSQSSGTANLRPKKIAAYNFPRQEFLDSGVGLGFISAEDDKDGVFRQYQLVANVDDIYLGSLALNSYDAFVPKEQKALLKIKKDGEGLIVINEKNLEVSNRGETKVRYVGAMDQFPHISFYDFVEARDDDPKVTALVKDKIVFIGSSAQGAHDLRNSPIDPKMPGVFAHMNLVHMLVHQYFYQPVDQSVQYSILLLVIGMGVFFLASRMKFASIDLITLLLMIFGSYLVDQVYLLPQGYELKLFYCYLCFIGCYSWNTFLNFSEANKEKKQVKGTFARYVAPTIVDEMLKDPEKLVVGGSRRDITCLFSDVRDFTSISEGLSPTELAHSLNIYMGKMTDIVFDTKGTLDKYIGDAIVAFWGAPLEIGNHAQFAVEAALKMMEALPLINQEFMRLGRPEFHVGIGLNSGECNVGNMGSSRIFSYTALGDNMNLGARLESLCKYYGAQILISEFTLKRIDTSNMKIRPIDNAIVKGKTTPVGIFEVLHINHFMHNDSEALDTYTKAHSLFLNRDFEGAKTLFGQISDVHPKDKPTKRFYDLCKKFAENPSLVTEQFFVTVMTEK